MSEFEIVQRPFGPVVRGKLAGQRKAREFHVRPLSGGTTLYVQADGCTGSFDFRTGEGKFTTKGEYFPHLAMAPRFTFPAEFVKACLAACPALGSETTFGGVTFINTIEEVS